MPATLMATQDRLHAQAHVKAYSMALDDFNPGDPELFRTDTLWPYFERLRLERPVHFCKASMFGPYWSITRYDDIVRVDTNHAVYSSASADGGIMIRDNTGGFSSGFIATDPPAHTAQRKSVTPMFTPAHLDQLASIIRARAGEVLDALPRNQPFDWVDRVSVELTTQMLATLFDFPWDERRKLSYWSNLATKLPQTPGDELEARQQLFEFGKYFSMLWQQRRNAPPGNDLLSMMAHSDGMRNIDLMSLIGTLIMLLVAGNDTTRNSLSAGVYALNLYPHEYQKLRQDHTLIETMVPEIIRWQTPLAHMRRTAMADTELGGQQIGKGDKVVMWYVSGNRDSDVIAEPDRFLIDRPKARQHLSFGNGIHRCVGSRLAELQLKIVWEEIMKRFENIEVVDEPTRVYSSLIRGYACLPVQVS